MTETTRKTLSTLASADNGEVRGLPIDRELYSEASLSAAIAAFGELCQVTRQPGTNHIDLQVRFGHRSRNRQILGAFLNFLLCDAVSRRA
jgi:hypothetical protein